MRIYFLFIICLFIIPLDSLQGQDDNCGILLLDARDLYDAGIVEEVPDLIKDCLMSGFSIEDLLEAYKLVINSYLFDGYPEKADSVMQAFLQVFPNYEPTAADPAEFQQLMETYQTDPYLSAGFMFGGNLSMPQLRESYGTSSPTLNKGSYPLSSLGFQVSGLLNVKLFHNAELGIELQFVRNQFSHKAQAYPFTSYVYNEQQNHVALPVSFAYMFSPNRVLKPYLRIGIKADYLISATASATRSYGETGDAVYKDVSTPNTDVTALRNNFNGMVFAGGGLRFKLSKSFVFIDARYCYSIMGANKGDKRYASPDLNWLIYYVDNDFQVNAFAFSIGYLRNFYNPKKKQ